MTDSPLSSKNKKILRGQAQLLTPILQIGKKGITPEIIKALEEHLNKAALIKISIDAQRKEREALTQALIEQLGAELISAIGTSITLYRPLEEMF